MTYASWHVQNGTPLYALQELGGWESVEMVQRYAHQNPTHLAEYSDALSNQILFARHLNPMAQLRHNKEIWK